MVMVRAYTFPFVILLACCVTACMATNMNLSTYKSALLAFKSRMISTIDPSNILIKNWSVLTPVCVWIGVTCGLRHQRVTAFDISSMNLSGNIPFQLGNLSFLVSLNLSRNYFYGSLPRELIQLRRLQIIDFGFNSFSGQIPSWFGFLQNLQLLNLRNNIFTGLIPLTIFNISTLETLSFRENNLSGNLPVDICRGLPRIKSFRLSLNELDGEIPSNLSECSQLQLLSLSFNKFRGSIPSEIGRIRTLQILYLGSNELSGAIPPELGNLENLVKLDMAENFLEGSIPASIFNISSLKRSNIGQNNLSGTLPANICSNCSQLEKVYLHVNELISVLDNQLSGNLDLLVLGYELPNLEELYLNNNNFHGRIPNSIANSSKLTEIDLFHNNFISESPELSFITSLTRCRYLMKLRFGDNPLNGFNGYSVHGFKFYNLEYGLYRTTMIMVCVLGSCYNEYECEYYGMLLEVWEIEYFETQNRVVLLKFDWYDNENGICVHPRFNLVEINHKMKVLRNDVFILSQQVYYTKFPSNSRDRRD